MRCPLLSLFAVTALLPLRAEAQNVLFNETFTAGVPATWTQIQHGWTGDRWLPRTTGWSGGNAHVFHEYFCDHGSLLRNNLLVTPRIDLSGFTRVDFACDQYQVFPQARALNTVEISTNGGSSFTPIYTENGMWTGAGTIRVNLDAWAGLPDVRIAFHYLGTVANEWSIDNVRVTTPQPIHSVANLQSGATATFALAGAGAGNGVVIGYSLSGPGPVPSPFGNVRLTPPVDLTFLVADGNGAASFTIAVPPGLVGLQVWSQGVALRPNLTGTLSNWLLRSVQ